MTPLQIFLERHEIDKNDYRVLLLMCWAYGKSDSVFIKLPNECIREICSYVRGPYDEWVLKEIGGNYNSTTAWKILPTLSYHNQNYQQFCWMAACRGYFERFKGCIPTPTLPPYSTAQFGSETAQFLEEFDRRTFNRRTVLVSDLYDVGNYQQFTNVMQDIEKLPPDERSRYRLVMNSYFY